MTELAAIDKTHPSYYEPRFDQAAKQVQQFVESDPAGLMHLRGVMNEYKGNGETCKGLILDVHFGGGVGNGEIWFLPDGHLWVEFSCESQREKFSGSLGDQLLQSAFDMVDWGCYFINVVEG